tara:strand:- start:2190 stop:2633 length:444 start_codon:yes stop_codon:yes gene_type:complete
MSSEQAKQTAEQRFRAAFDRLKQGSPEVLARTAAVSQNNVAKEANCDPSALRKSRFPSLVAEIQHYVEMHKGDVPDSERQQMLRRRRSNRKTKDLINDLRQQRDVAAGLLLEANTLIVELHEQLIDANKKLNEYKPTTATINFNKVR